GTVTSWSVVADSASVGGQLTPLLFDFTGAIVGIGTTRTITAAGRNDFDFGLAAGNNVVGFGGNLATYFGWRDGTPQATSAAGVLPFTTSPQFVWTYTTSSPLTVGQPFNFQQQVQRTYSVEFHVSNNTNVGNSLGDRGVVHAGGQITIDRE